MMARLKQGEDIGFKVIQLHKNKILGIGTYGKVCQAECDGLLCAAKLYNDSLFDPNAQHRLPLRRFEQECEFLQHHRAPKHHPVPGYVRRS